MRLAKRIGLYLFVPLIVLSTCACQSTEPHLPDPTNTSSSFTPQTATPFLPETEFTTSFDIPEFVPTITPAYQNKFFPRIQYSIKAHLDYQAHILQAVENIYYTNNTDRILDSLMLAVEPNLWKNCFVLERVLVNLKPAQIDLRGHTLEVFLNESLPISGSLEISLKYQLNLPLTDSKVVFGIKNNQINLVNWYPYIVPFRDGWSIHDPGWVGEYLVYDSADYDIDFTVSPPMTIAASTIAEGPHYHLEQARTFAFSISPDFLTSYAMLNDIMVTSYFFAGDEISGSDVLGESIRALEYFTDIFGDFPHQSLSIVESVFFDGMEYDGVYFLGQKFYKDNDGTKLNYLIDLSVHETAHQWWFSRVGNDQALEPWLDEALATYSEYLFYDSNYPGVSDTWWQFRVDKFSPAGYVDISVYSTNIFQHYTNHVYLRGAQFLRDVRERIGNENFFAFLIDYSTQMGGKIATSDDFFRILADHTDEDLGDIIGMYFTQIP